MMIHEKCPRCRGRGRDDDGAECWECGGSGWDDEDEPEEPTDAE